MAEYRKSYGEGCLAAHALDLIGDRWALLIVRELMLGPKRFSAIREHLPGIATNMLTRRLSDLETAGIVSHRTLPPPARVPVYELTAQGLALGPLLTELCRWGVGVPGHDPTLPISPTALMLSMQSLLLPGSGDQAAGFTMQDEQFLFEIIGNRPIASRADQMVTDIHFTGAANNLAAVIYGPQTLVESIAGGLTRFHGDIERGQAFIDRFRLARPHVGS